MRVLGASALLVLGLLLPPPALADTLPVGAGACGGVAPFLNSCTTGSHNATGFLLHGTQGIGYTGRVESTLRWDSGQVLLRSCEYNAGSVLTCTVTGQPGPFGIPFVQTCVSFALGTNHQGGTGVWLCDVILE